MSASLRPHYRRSRSASAVRFTRPLKPPQSSFYCCKGPTPAEKPRSSPRKPITAFPSGEKLRLTLLSISNSNTPAIALRDGEPRIGERAYAIGNPEGLELTLSDGLISG